MRSTTGIQIVGFDHVRAFAALLVFVWHFAHPPFGSNAFGYVPHVFALSVFNEGHTGVSLFMTLSGFIFSFLSHEKDIQVGQFWKNRFLRVFPLLFFWCLFGVAFQGYNATDVVRDVFTLIDNKIPAGGWTVIVEAQFYLLFPFVHPTVEKCFREKGLVGVASYVLPFIGFMWFVRWGTLMETGSAQTISFWSIFGRIDQFLLGVFFFYVYRSRLFNLKAHRAGIALAVVGLVLLVFYRWFNIKGGWAHYGTYPSPARIWIALPTIEGVIYGSGIALYLCLSRQFRGPVSRLVSYIGTISYSIYLANFFVLPLLAVLHAHMPFTHTDGFGEYFIWGLVIGFPLICLFAAFTYKFVEQPFLARRRRYVSDLGHVADAGQTEPRVSSVQTAQAQESSGTSGGRY